MVFAIQIKPRGGEVASLTAGERFYSALDHKMWEEAAALLAKLTDEDREYLVELLRKELLAEGQALTKDDPPFPNPDWYGFSWVGEQCTRLFLRALPELIAWSQAYSVRKRCLGIDCLFTAVHRQDYETARLIVFLDPRAALRIEMGSTVALHHVVKAPRFPEEEDFDVMAQRGVSIAVLIYHTALKAIHIKGSDQRTPLERARDRYNMETDRARKAVYAQILHVLENSPSRLLALGLSVAQAEPTPCPLRRFVLSKIFERHVLRIVLSFLTLV